MLTKFFLLYPTEIMDYYWYCICHYCGCYYYVPSTNIDIY